MRNGLTHFNSQPAVRCIGIKPATRYGGGSDVISEPTVQSGWEKENAFLVRVLALGSARLQSYKPRG